MKYFRDYTWVMQLMLFLFLAFTFLMAMQLMTPPLLSSLTPYTLRQIITIDDTSPRQLINAAIAVQGLGNLFCYLLPAALFGYLTHPEPRTYLGLTPPAKKIQWLLVVLVMLGAIPLLGALEGVMSQINFGPKVKEAQLENDNIFKAFLDMPDFTSFLRVFVAVAIIPAFGEELFFRAVILRLAAKRARAIVLPIVFTAAVFALSHSNIYGLPSIFLAGMLLAVIYYLTGSLWCSILAHLVFNGSQIILSYVGKSNAAVGAFLASPSMPYSFIIGGAILFAVSFYLLLKNKTPLPANWTDDFPPEPPAPAWDFMENK